MLEALAMLFVMLFVCAPPAAFGKKLSFCYTEDSKIHIEEVRGEKSQRKTKKTTVPVYNARYEQMIKVAKDKDQEEENGE